MHGTTVRRVVCAWDPNVLSGMYIYRASVAKWGGGGGGRGGKCFDKN